MLQGGTLAVASRLSRDGTEVEIAFADTGVGIAKENIPSCSILSSPPRASGPGWDSP